MKVSRNMIITSFLIDFLVQHVAIKLVEGKTKIPCRLVPKNRLSSLLFRRQFKVGPKRGKDYNPNYGYEPYWPQGDWVFSGRSNCTEDCPQMHEEFGEVCGRNLNYTHKTFDNYCELQKEDCSGRSKWLIAYRGKCQDDLKTYPTQQSELVTRALKYISDFDANNYYFWMDGGIAYRIKLEARTPYGRDIRRMSRARWSHLEGFKTNCAAGVVLRHENVSREVYYHRLRHSSSDTVLCASGLRSCPGRARQLNPPRYVAPMEGHKKDDPSRYNPAYGYEPYWEDGHWVFKDKELPPDATTNGTTTTTSMPQVCGEECDYLYKEIKHVCARMTSLKHYEGCGYYCHGQTLDDLTKGFTTFPTYCKFLDAQCRSTFEDKWIFVHMGECIDPQNLSFKPIVVGDELVSRKTFYYTQLSETFANHSLPDIYFS